MRLLQERTAFRPQHELMRNSEDHQLEAADLKRDTSPSEGSLATHITAESPHNLIAA